MNRLSLQVRTRILSCLIEGNSMRSTARMVDVSLNTVAKFLRDLGAACTIYQNEAMRNLPCKRLQVDEIWSFVASKQKNTALADRAERGDIWTWVAIDADTKLVPAWHVGKRDTATAGAFIADLAARLANRVQLTTDGFKPYLNAVETSFRGEIDYAVLVKLYKEASGGVKQERKYSAGECCGTIKGTVCGNPDETKISTSFVERQNLTMRMGMRRFTRLTNGFSKKLSHHEYAIAIHYMHYNFGRIHKSLRVTPAMQAGITERAWSLEEIAKLAD